jgi:hypothetical protein
MYILPEAASEFPHPTPQRDWRQLKGIVSLNSAFENESQKHASKSFPAYGTVYRIIGGSLMPQQEF